MSELRLTRSPEDRTVFVLAGVGTIRNGRWLKRSAELCAETAAAAAAGGAAGGGGAAAAGG